MNKNISLLLAATLSLGLASCSLFTGQGTVKRQEPLPEGVTNIVPKDEPVQAKTKAPAAPTQQPTQEAAATPAPSVEAKPEAAKPEPAKPVQEQPVASKLMGKLNGEWLIIQAEGQNIKLEDDMPYIHFEERSGRFYASNGCNILNGNFKLDGANEISFSNVISTLMSCPDVPFEKGINKVLNGSQKLKVDIHAKGEEWYMRFHSPSNKVLLILRRHNMEVLNGKWQVTEISGEKIDNPDVNVFFDITDLTIHGNTGCNFFNGVILVDPEVGNSINFSQMGVTMRACENSDIEMAMLVALEQVTNYKISSKDKLQLLDPAGKTLIILHRAK